MLLATLQKIALALDPSALATQLLQENLSLTETNSEPEPKVNPGLSPSILFIGETRFGSETFKETARLMPILIKHLPLSGQLECQLLRAFLGNIFPKLRETRLDFCEYKEFNIWFTENKAMLDPKPSASKKNKKITLTSTDLEKACKTNVDFCRTLYQELCLLAPHGKYKSGNNINITGSSSNFNINLYSKVKKQIEDILVNYRHWMTKHKKLGLGISDLTALRITLNNAASDHKHFDYIVWNSKQKISPNIRKFLDQIANETIDLPPYEMPKAMTSTSNAIMITEPEPDTSTQSTLIDDDTYWMDEANDLIDSLSFRDKVILEENEQQLLNESEFIQAMLSTKDGKDALEKILTATPIIAEIIFENLSSSTETLISFILFITQRSPSNLISIHYTIMQKTMRVFSGIIDLYLHIRKDNRSNLLQLMAAIFCASAEEHDHAPSTLKLLCLPNNHKTFIKLISLRLNQGLHYYWGRIKDDFNKKIPTSGDESPLCNLLQTIYGIAVLNQFIQADTSNKLKHFLGKKAAGFLSQTFSARMIHLPAAPQCSYPEPPFYDLLNASIFVEFELHLTESSTRTAVDILSKTILFLAKNSMLENDWPAYMRCIYASIITTISNYMGNFPAIYWENEHPEFPWDDLLSLTTLCSNQLNDIESLKATSVLFQLTQYQSMSTLLDEGKLFALHQKIQASPNYGKHFFEASIEYLLHQNVEYIKEFAEKSIHSKHYLTFISLIDHFNVNNKKEEQFIAHLLDFFGENLQKIFLSISTPENTIMYEQIFNVFSCKQESINEINSRSPIKIIIFDLAIFFVEKLLEVSQENHSLYKEALRVIEATQIKGSKDLAKVFTVFKKIHAHTLIQIVAPNDWKAAYDMYFQFLTICIKMEEFSGRYKFAINAYLMAKSYLDTFKPPKNARNLEWHSAIYLYALIMCVSELAIAGKNPETIEPCFFDTVFNFSNTNPIDNSWTNDQIKRIFSVSIDFFINSIQLIRQEKLSEKFSWAQLTSLISKQEFFCFDGAHNIIDKMIDAVNLVASTPADCSSNIRSLLKEICVLQTEFDQNYYQPCNTTESISLSNNSITFYSNRICRIHEPVNNKTLRFDC